MKTDLEKIKELKKANKILTIVNEELHRRIRQLENIEHDLVFNNQNEK